MVDRNFSSLAVSVMRATDQSEEADMSNIDRIHSSAKEDRTDLPQQLEEILLHKTTLGDSEVADRVWQNDIRLRAKQARRTRCYCAAVPGHSRPEYGFRHLLVRPYAGGR